MDPNAYAVPEYNPGSQGSRKLRKPFDKCGRA